jgi:hypothetical protein
MAQRIGIKAHVLASLSYLGGDEDLVTLTALRAAIPAIRREVLDKALLEMERGRDISLRVAQSPMSLGDRAKDGIYKDERGLLYYVMLRE